MNVYSLAKGTHHNLGNGEPEDCCFVVTHDGCSLLFFECSYAVFMSSAIIKLSLSEKRTGGPELK